MVIGHHDNVPWPRHHFCKNDDYAFYPNHRSRVGGASVSFRPLLFCGTKPPNIRMDNGKTGVFSDGNKNIKITLQYKKESWDWPSVFAH